MRHLVWAAVLAAVVTACGNLPITGRRVPAQCEFPDDMRRTFAGETTMAELGIPAPGSEDDPVYAWVTADPIRFPSMPDAHRAACVEKDDGTFERSAFPGALIREQND